MVCYHSINNLNNLKGAGSIMIKAPRARTNINAVGGGPNKNIIPIPETELKLVDNTLNIARLYISKNPQLFQNPELILDKVNQSLLIVSSKLNNKSSTKGASNNNTNICSTTKKKQSLINIKEHFGLS
jgi:hypothetical protein